MGGARRVPGTHTEGRTQNLELWKVKGRKPLWGEILEGREAVQKNQGRGRVPDLSGSL